VLREGRGKAKESEKIPNIMPFSFFSPLGEAILNPSHLSLKCRAKKDISMLGVKLLS